ncbi:MAG: Type 1 glutamine amidotransferase-like domain-containing protein [Acidimicrobiales bacterium]
MTEPGIVALVGSGEFLEVMESVDRKLLAGRPPRAVFLPTASAEEGEARISYWIELGRSHFERLGVEALPLKVLTRADANDERLAGEIAGAGLIYLSGGNPGYLADTLRDSAVWKAIVAAFHAGSSLAGCSAGACALTAVADDLRHPGRFSGKGLDVVSDLGVIPHFDRIADWIPDIVDRALAEVGAGTVVVGIDEETAIMGDGRRFTVAGRRSAWHLSGHGERTEYKEGAVLDIDSLIELSSSGAKAGSAEREPH